ncbi:Fungal Zn2-Cys6 binuclear cluster domain-containing protein [Cladophialophora immunda]|nr:Fungal Zn2-Cys6 binuclear cluster domain-containing protein [Cladophialophora immunda]
MVYCGKPSKGCDYCRKKRLKCDQKRPGCGQCRNASRACPGYRNQLDLMFRDESDRVQQKYRVTAVLDADAEADADADVDIGTVNANQSSGHDSAADTSTPLPDTRAIERGLSPDVAGNKSTQISKLRKQPWPDHPYQSLSQALPEIATAFFLTQYIPGSHFDYLPLLYNSANPASLLTGIVEAVSLASLSHETRKPEFMALARQRYSQSLVETNKALQDPSACRDDGTLASILLLAHFETLASEDTIGVEDVALAHANTRYSPSASWNRHVQGAVSLVSLRPKPQLDCSLSVRLHQHVNAIARYSSIQRRIRLPAEISSWGFSMGLRRDREDPNRRFMVVVDDFTELRASIHEGSLTDPFEIIEHAKAIDAHTALVARGFPSAWAYDVVVTRREMDGVYQNKYHLYPSHYSAQLWNEVRMTRLALNEIILVYAEKARRRDPLDGEVDDIFTSLRSRCVRVIEQMATEICQSTTEFLQKPDCLFPFSGAVIVQDVNCQRLLPHLAALQCGPRVQGGVRIVQGVCG